MNVEEALNWIAEVFEEAPGRLKAETLRKDVATWDSLGTLTLIAGLDERFDVHLSEKEIEGMQSVADILEILRRGGKLDG
jgi:acyl carrier protein